MSDANTKTSESNQNARVWADAVCTVPDGEPVPVIKGSHVYLVDGSGYIFRAFHALPPLTRPSDGLPVGAVHGFSAMLWKLLVESRASEAPTHLAVIFDAGRETFRNDLYKDYKAHRPPAPEELVPQFSLIRDAVRAFNVACIEQDGYEADDLIATYAREAAERGGDVTIVSSDKDLMQLVRPGVVMFDGMKNKRIGRDEVFEKFGVWPDKVVDVQSLAGDSVDNVPGVPGIGIKTAAAIVRDVGDLDRILNVEDDKVDTEFQDLVDRQTQLQAEIDAVAGETVKLGSGAQLGKILVEKLGVPARELKVDKKGNATADTATVELLAERGNEFCRKIIDCRNLGKTLTSHIGHIRAHAPEARISRELVTLKDDVPLAVPIEGIGVQDVKPGELLAFTRAMEFTKLTKRFAEKLGVEVPALAEKRTSPSLTARGGGDGRASVANPPHPSLQEGGEQAKAGELHGPGTPQAGAAIRSAELAKAPFDRLKYELVTTASRLAEWVQMSREAGRLAFDIETTALDCMTCDLVGFSMAIAPGVACYVPVGHRASAGGFDFGEGGGIVQAPLQDALALMKPLLEDQAVLKIGQNIKFDMLVMARYGIRIAPIDDTMLISYVLDVGRGGHGMDDLAERHLGHACIAFDKVLEHAPGAKKAEKTFAEVPLDKACEYAAEDADVTLRLWMKLKPRLVAERLVTVYETLERPLVPVITGMEHLGILVDRSVLARLSSTFAQSLARLEEEINGLVGHKFNLASPKQLGELLFDRLQLPGGKRTKSGQWETRAGLLDDLAANEDVPDEARRLINTMLEWRQLSKLRSTYTDALPAFIHKDTGRIHTSYALASTTTGRLASSDPNLQNIPIRTKEGREIRTAFIADRGMKLVSADYSQIELRVLAHIADIAQLKRAFADGLDIHAMTASEMFGVPVKDMPSDVRRRAKAINFGIIYGISAFGLANQLGISREEAGAYIKTYFERFPGIRDYMEATKRRVHEHGYVETIFGRRIHYPEVNTKNPSMRGFLERAAINAPIQGSAADIIRRAMIRMGAALETARLDSARMLLQVHDELVFEVSAAHAGDLIKIACQVMEIAAEPAVQLSVPIHVDAKSADNWEAAH
ncbi:MAG: DNA polymerase I [Hyphomicrobium sp.]|jgi:DNA polymerase-1